MQLHTSLYIHTTIPKTFPLPYSDNITHLAGCIGCIPGTCWGCCAAAAGGWWGLISWPGGIITCDTGTPGGPPLPCMATAGPGTPTQHEKGRKLLNKIHHCISGYRHFEQKNHPFFLGSVGRECGQFTYKGNHSERCYFWWVGTHCPQKHCTITQSA
jgi:hypothetical protein